MVNFDRHVANVEELMSQKALRALVVMGSSNIFYLVGSDAPSAVVVFDDGNVLTLSTRLEYVRTLEETRVGTHFTFYKGVELAEFENAIKGDFQTALKELLKDAPAGKIGAVGLSQDVKKKLEDNLGFEVSELTRDFLKLRRRKEPSEVEALRSAARVAEKALTRALSVLEEGVTEADVAAEIIDCMLRSGSQPSFSPIVAFGEHAAHPHAKPSLKKLRKGSVVKIDLGARVEGYCSDLTRTFIFGYVKDDIKKAFQTVLNAEETSIDLVKPGVQAREVHQRAVAVLKEGGLLKYFNHGLGHGVGIDVHEEPYINAESDTLLQPGDVVTIEPGAYVKGVYGIRVEDTILVTENGAELLTCFPKTLDYL